MGGGGGGGGGCTGVCVLGDGGGVGRLNLSGLLLLRGEGLCREDRTAGQPRPTQLTPSAARLRAGASERGAASARTQLPSPLPLLVSRQGMDENSDEGVCTLTSVKKLLRLSGNLPLTTYCIRAL